MDGYKGQRLQQSKSSIQLRSQGQKCGASTINRARLLCNESNRRSSLGEIRRLLREISNSDLANKIESLVQEVFMDAEYRERTNMQMREMVVGLEEQLMNYERGGARQDEGYVRQLQ